MTTKNKPTVLATLTKADGSVVEILVGAEAAPAMVIKPQPLKPQRINKGAVLKGLPTEERSFLADVPVFESGKLVGFAEEERKAARVVGRIAVRSLDLRKYQGKNA